MKLEGINIDLSLLLHIVNILFHLMMVLDLGGKKIEIHFYAQKVKVEEL